MSNIAFFPSSEPTEPLARLKQEILDGHAQMQNGQTNWLDGALKVAAALHKARQEVGEDDSRLGQWLRDNKLNFCSKDDRAALIHIGAVDPAVARTAFLDEPTLSCRALWDQIRGRYREQKAIRNAAKGQYNTKPQDPMHLRPPRSLTRGLIARKIKLGEKTFDAIKGTSLDTTYEMDALIALNRHDPSITERLVAEAAGGATVSAVAEVTKLGRKSGPSGKRLVDEFNRRMNQFWASAEPAAQEELVTYLMNHMKDDKGSK